ncbi:MAG: 3-carboxymuconate cyclase, partial [Rhizobacter sp.]|nr:3-carboxymuconate cyclase [Rhizobacter sp.]
MSPSTEAPLTLHLSVGPALIAFAVDRHDLSRTEVGRVVLAAPIQYVWPHPTRSLLYVASSNRSISKADDVHSLATVEVDERTGALRVIGQVDLPTRPIHLTVEPSGLRLFVAYNVPSLVTVHAIRPDGRATQATPQASPPSSGIYPHQVLVMPSGRAAIVVARGDDARHGKPEQPGSLRVLSLEDDALRPLQTVAPGDGYGFGPRHLDFHPSGRWVAVSIERQNELHVYSLTGDTLSAEPVFKLSTLPAPPRSPHDQLAGAIRFHPNGKTLYVVNRNDTAIYGDGTIPSDFEGNNIAVYSFDDQTGRPELLQYVLTESVHVRTFSLDVTGRILVAASILPSTVRRGDGVEKVPARLSFFRVANDGRLTLARLDDMGNERESMFWSRL